MSYKRTKMPFVTCDSLSEDYKVLKSLAKIAKKYNVSKSTIIYYFKKLNISYVKKIRSYSVDHNFFSNETEESFYWAGFLAADGCISIRKNFNNKNVILNLGQNDLDHLIKFKNAIKSFHPIKKKTTLNSNLNANWNDRDGYTITIGSHQMVKDLERFNIVPNKTKIYDLPQWLMKHELINHFLRGYFDGDGCFYKVKMGKKSGKVSDQFRISFAGNFNFLNNVGNIISSVLNISNKSINFNGSINVLTYGGNNLTLKVGAFLYKDALSFLERKYNLWKEFNDYYNSRKFVRS